MSVLATISVYFSVFVILPVSIKIYLMLTMGKCRSRRRLDGQTVIVTGANTGIGLETAKEFAIRGARVILACRNLRKAAIACEEIQRQSGNTNVILKHLDLCSLVSVRKFAAEIISEESRLDILVNNAAIIVNSKVLTADKLETTFQTNHFGPFLLTNLLLGSVSNIRTHTPPRSSARLIPLPLPTDKIRRTGKARVVMVSAFAHNLVRHLDLDNLNSEKYWGTAIMVYFRTKFGNVLFMRELHRRLQEIGANDITVNAVHPGMVRTTLGLPLFEAWYVRCIWSVLEKLFFKNLVEGAQTSIYAAVSEDLGTVSGEFISDCNITGTSQLTRNVTLTKRFWDESAKIVCLKPDETIL